MTDLDRQGGAGWRKGLPGSLDGEVGHDLSTLRVSPQGNKHSLPGFAPGSWGPGNHPFPSYLAGVSRDLCSLLVAEGTTGPSQGLARQALGGLAEALLVPAG